MAKDSGIPIDMLRKTKNPENVKQLESIKGFIKFEKTIEKKG